MIHSNLINIYHSLTAKKIVLLRLTEVSLGVTFINDLYFLAPLET